ncbi:deoxyguanosinetriphosphate triphosphohydrolase [Deinococcus peraridilitoris]|uniref:deoxyguanosinetriphosphate triphosphohydrolase n=1 Tax=Deinococcus peraridilitoris TaxID=432329 RepID=UPI003CCBA5D9
MVSRDMLLQRERATLAPYATFSDESRGRRYPEGESAHRSPYQKDRDRVLHTTAFRRLEYKTQVFVNYQGDYYRTRLTHTLEVTQVARSVALALGLNETLAETIALAHDLGHPPFGHAGERILNGLMREHGGFEHNRQSLRIVTQIENRYEGFPGLNLTWETLEGIVKHETLFDQEETSDIPDYEPSWRPSLEAQIANVADETAYNAHDLDDGLRSGLITPRDLRGLALWDKFIEELNLDPDHFDEKQRRIVIRELLGWMINDLIQESHRRIEYYGVTTLGDVRRVEAPLIGQTDEARALLSDLKRFLFAHLYNHHRVVRQVHKAEHFLRTLFEAYCKRPAMLPPSVREVEKKHGLERAVCDYLAGMTDRYAMEEYRKLYDPYVRT